MAYNGDFWQDMIRLNPTWPRPSLTAAIPNVRCWECGLLYAEELVHFCPTGVTGYPPTILPTNEMP